MFYVVHCYLILNIKTNCKPAGHCCFWLVLTTLLRQHARSSLYIVNLFVDYYHSTVDFPYDASFFILFFGFFSGAANSVVLTFY